MPSSPWSWPRIFGPTRFGRRAPSSIGWRGRPAAYESWSPGRMKCLWSLRAAWRRLSPSERTSGRTWRRRRWCAPRAARSHASMARTPPMPTPARSRPTGGFTQNCSLALRAVCRIERPARSWRIEFGDYRLTAQSVSRKQVAVRTVDMLKRLVEGEGLEPAARSGFPRDGLHARPEAAIGRQFLDHHNAVMRQQGARNRLNVERLQGVHGRERHRPALLAKPLRNVARQLHDRSVGQNAYIVPARQVAQPAERPGVDGARGEIRFASLAETEIDRAALLRHAPLGGEPRLGRVARRNDAHVRDCAGERHVFLGVVGAAQRRIGDAAPDAHDRDRQVLIAEIVADHLVRAEERKGRNRVGEWPQTA